MSTVKLFCPQGKLSGVMAAIMESNVKYWPVERYWHNLNLNKIGYRLELEKDHPVVSFLILKFELNILSDDYV
jgi:hypothetical protein